MSINGMYQKTILTNCAFEILYRHIYFHDFILSISGQTFVKTTHTGLTETDASRKQMNWNMPLPGGAPHMKDIHILMLVKTFYTKTQVKQLF